MWMRILLPLLTGKESLDCESVRFRGKAKAGKIKCFGWLESHSGSLGGMRRMAAKGLIATSMILKATRIFSEEVKPVGCESS
jgi:hypothetical protein